MNYATIVCPIDNKDDAIQKVSAIVSGIKDENFGSLGICVK